MGEGVAAVGLIAIEPTSEHLVFVVGRDPEGLSGKGSAFGDDRVVSREEGRGVLGADLPADGRVGVRVNPVLVDDLPEARGLETGGLLGVVGVLEDARGGHEGVAEGVARVACRERRADGIVLDDRVVEAVDHGVDADGEKVLVVLGVDLGRDGDAVGAGGLVWRQDVGVEDAGGLDLVLERAVLVKVVVEAVVVVGDGDKVGEDEAARADGVGAGGVAVVGVLEEDAVVFFVQADGVGHVDGLPAGGVAEDGVKVVDGAEAVAAELERVGAEAEAVLADVKGVFAVVRRERVGVRNDHFGQRDAVKERAGVVAAVAVAHVVDDEAFAVVHGDAQVPVLPVDLVAADGERDAQRLLDDDGFQVVAKVLVADKVW